MILVEKRCAEGLMACIRHFTPFFPKYVLDQVELLEGGLMSGHCDEILLMQIYSFIRAYLQKKNDEQKKELFFEQTEKSKHDDDERMWLDLLIFIQLILPENFEYQNKIVRGIKK